MRQKYYQNRVIGKRTVEFCAVCNRQLTEKERDRDTGNLCTKHWNSTLNAETEADRGA